jgi:MFS family permease
MAKSVTQVFKDVLSNKNILTIALTTSLITLTDMSYRSYWQLYLKHNLGADMVAIGLLGSIASSERLLFQLPGGILADRYGRRKIIVFGTALRIIPPIIYLFATHWTHTIPALLFSGTASIYMPAFNAIIADSLPRSERGAGYGAYRTITSIPMMFAPFLGGMVMDAYGYEVGIKAFMVMGLFVNIIVTYARHRMLRETLIYGDTAVTRKRRPPECQGDGSSILLG